MRSADSPDRTRRASRPRAFDLHGLIFEAASDDTPADRRVDPAINRRVGDCGQSLQVFQRVNVLAVTGAIDQQVIDGGVGREARESGLELGSGQPAEVRDGEAGLERLELAPGDNLVLAVRRSRAGDDEDLAHFGLQSADELERVAEVQLGDEASRVFEVAACGRRRKEDDWRARKQLVRAPLTSSSAGSCTAMTASKRTFWYFRRRKSRTAAW